MKIQTKAFFVILIGIYLFCSFASWNFNPGEWNVWIRLIAGILSVYATFSVLLR